MACALARCPGRCASRVLRAWLPRSLACPVCCAPGAWAALPAGALGRCTVWVGCVPGVLASWPALCGWAVCAPVHGPALWAVWLGLIFRPFIAAFLEGLLKKAFIFALYFSGIFSLDFSPLCAGLYFFWFIFPASRSRIFFLRIFLRRNFRRIFPDLFFRIFSCPIFATVSGFLFFLDIIFI